MTGAPAPGSGQGSAAALSQADIDGRVKAFHEISGVFENRAAWLLVGDNTSDMGVNNSAINPEHQVFLLRLTMLKSKRIISTADLVILPGQTASLTVPTEEESSLHYRIHTSEDHPTQLMISAQLLTAKGAERWLPSKLRCKSSPARSFPPGTWSLPPVNMNCRSPLAARNWIGQPRLQVGETQCRAATILIIVLSHQGYWFGGQDQTVAVSWPVDGKMPAADLDWKLMLGQVKLAEGRSRMPDGGNPMMITLKLPPVRTKLEMRWNYRLTESTSGKELLSGECPVEVFPPISLDGLASQLANKRLFVVDRPDGLPSLLAGAKIDATHVASTQYLANVNADLVLVAANQLDDSLFDQAPLLSQAESGAQVMVFEQTRPKSLFGYTLSRRAVSSNTCWRKEHPLFEGF